MRCYSHDGKIEQLDEVGIYRENYKLLKEIATQYGTTPDTVANLLVEWFYNCGYAPMMLFKEEYWG